MTDTGVALSVPGSVGPNWLTLPEDISFQEWEKVGSRISMVGESMQWWIGDWANFGDRKWGDLPSIAARLGISYALVRDAAWVASRVPIAGRHANLSWTYHRAVASLDADSQNHLLNAAERHGWNRDELRRAAAARRLSESADGGGITYELDTDRKRHIAEKNYERLGILLGQTQAVADGLEAINLDAAMAVLKEDDARQWVEDSKKTRSALLRLAKRMRKESEHVDEEEAS